MFARAYVFVLSLVFVCTPVAQAESLQRQAKLYSPARDPEGITQQYLGRSMSVSGSVAAISDGVQSDGDIVRIFERNAAGGWLPVATLNKPPGLDASQRASFGQTMSLDGTRLVVGIRGNQNAAVRGDFLIVYDKLAGIWQETARISPTLNDKADDFAGGGISLSGDTIAVGSPGALMSGQRSGVVDVFVKQAGVWVAQPSLAASDAQPADRFGYRVQLQGDRMVVSRAGRRFQEHETSGVYVFERTNGAWGQRARITMPPETSMTAGTYFGRSFALDAEQLAIPDIEIRNENNTSVERDVIRMYARANDGTWTRTANLAAGRHSGNSSDGPTRLNIALQGTRLLVGQTYLNNDLAAGTIPKVFFFERTDGVWSNPRTLSPFDWNAGVGVRYGAGFGDLINQPGGIAFDERGAALIAAPLDGLPPLAMNTRPPGAVYLFADSSGLFCNGFEETDPARCENMRID